MDVKKEATRIHESGHNCAQSVFCSCREYTGIDDKTALAISGGFGGGVRCGEICGALSGAVMAIGAVRALWEAGKRVPEDVSVIGLDGLAIGSYMIPQLSTIRQDFQTIALRSVAILLRHIEDGTAAVHETVPHKLHLRESIRSIAD